jgi:4-amino-4-deoxy-L-arabinose transferase-like glycosyltransferase
MNWRLGLVLLLTAFLRLWHLGVTPPSLYWEEVALGYDAYSLWQTGKDHHGNPWPIVAFESFGDYKPSGYFYMLAPFVGLMGLSEFSVRLPSALFGILTVWLVYFLILALERKRRVALIGALLLAILPWHVHISRVGFEINAALFWYVLGVYGLIRYQQRPKWMVVAILGMTISMYTYHAFRLIVPLSLILLVLTTFHLPSLLRSWRTYLGLLVSLLMIAPLIAHIQSPLVRQRYEEVNMFSQSQAVPITNSWRERFDNEWWARVVFHRYWWWTGEISANAASHFSPLFLFWHGDGNARHQLPEHGLLYWFMLPLVVAGIVALYYKQRRHTVIIIYMFLIIPLLPAALSLPTPHALRTLPMTIGYVILAAVGYDYLVRRILSLKYVIGIIGGISVLIYLLLYFGEYSRKYAHDWQYGYKEAITYVENRRQVHEKILFTRAYGRPVMYVLFYTKAQPQTVQAISPFAAKDQAELLTYEAWDFQSKGIENYDWVVWHQPRDERSLTLEKTISYPSGKTAFYIYRQR